MPPLAAADSLPADAVSSVESSYHKPTTSVTVAGCRSPEPESPVVNASMSTTSKSGTVSGLIDMTGEIDGSLAQVCNRFEEILPVPVQKRTHSTRVISKSSTHVLTSKEHSDFLEVKQSRKKRAGRHTVQVAGDEHKAEKNKWNKCEAKDQSKVKKPNSLTDSPPAYAVSPVDLCAVADDTLLDAKLRTNDL